MDPQGTFKCHDKIRSSRHEDLDFRHRASEGTALHIHATRHSLQFTRIDHLCKSPSWQTATGRLVLVGIFKKLKMQSIRFVAARE